MVFHDFQVSSPPQSGTGEAGEKKEPRRHGLKSAHPRKLLPGVLQRPSTGLSGREVTSLGVCKQGLDSHHGEECPELGDRLGTGALKAEALWKGRISCGYKEGVLDSTPVSAAGWPWPG